MTDAKPRRLVHLVRHGEVWNPQHVVYSDLPGFGLSALGHTQAAETAHRLAERSVARVVSSPLQRAVETAIPIAAEQGLRVVVDPELTEWRMAQRWSGFAWERLPETHPGELEAYLEDPSDLPFSPEPLDELARRIATAVRRQFAATDRDGDLVLVSHQDPIHAAQRLLTGRSFAAFFEDPPDHATIISLTPPANDGDSWYRHAQWSPPQTATV